MRKKDNATVTLSVIIKAMKIDDMLKLEGKDWRVVMLTKAYATIERVKNPKVSKMIRL